SIFKHQITLPWSKELSIFLKAFWGSSSPEFPETILHRKYSRKYLRKRKKIRNCTSCTLLKMIRKVISEFGLKMRSVVYRNAAVGTKPLLLPTVTVYRLT